MRWLLLGLSLSLAACSPGFETDPRTIVGTNQAFIPYINTYLAYKGTGLSYDIPIQFAKLSGSTIGVCIRWSSGHRQIQIDQDYWNHYLTEGEKHETIAHELGHCDLNRGHVTQSYPPTSIMDPFVFGLTTKSIANYMYELFHPGSTASKMASVLKTDCVQDIEVVE